MAEIKIEKKKPLWPWVIVVLLLAAIIYFVFLKDNETRVENTSTIENTTSADTIK
ncbi:hypothetical protein [Flavobacterium hydrophilum]|uniref:hypothetical protein n=1 Tax=Flavobacterium hydrophilum TaxID=2211445 RepID=UPI001401F133|nr:hypothetical protein [Flavobacterium hydrophilum]